METVLRLNRRLLNPFSYFAMPVCQEENPHPEGAYQRYSKPEDYHRVNTFFTSLDKILAEMENRFSGNDQDVLCTLGDITLRYHFRTATPQENYDLFLISY